ncbi:MAG: ABC transporter ATP-binding protein [Burkholderiaceae bacterium]|nr:ABC transporter ATP-binding protein [Microbacteriaceae bacterium]
MTTLASLEHVTRRYGAVTAVDDVTLHIESGTILGLLGPNGAGKTTVISLLQGLRTATSGTVRLFGGDPADAAGRSHLGSTPQETALPATLRVGEVVDFVGAHFEHRVPTAELAREFGFDGLLRRQTGSLSGGQKRRLSVALAFVGRPKLVLLDEPTTGLDVEARCTLWAALTSQHERGATIVVTSHYLEEIEALAQRVVVMGEGRVLADDSLSGVLERVGLARVRLESSELGRVAALPGVDRVESDRAGVDPAGAGDATSATFFVRDPDAFVTALVRSGIAFRGLGVRGATLEEAFLSLTGPPPAPPSAATSVRKGF